MEAGEVKENKLHMRNGMSRENDIGENLQTRVTETIHTCMAINEHTLKVVFNRQTASSITKLPTKSQQTCIFVELTSTASVSPHQLPL